MGNICADPTTFKFEAMADGGNNFGFELDERDPRLFRHPHERLLTLRRPGRPDLKLTVMLSYVEGAVRAVVTSAQAFTERNRPAQLGMPPEEWDTIQQLVRRHFGAEPFDAPTSNSRS